MKISELLDEIGKQDVVLLKFQRSNHRKSNPSEVVLR